MNSGIQAWRTDDGFTVSFAFADAELITAGMEYVEQRLIGQMPAVFARIELALWAANDRAD